MLSSERPRRTRRDRSRALPLQPGNTARRQGRRSRRHSRWSSRRSAPPAGSGSSTFTHPASDLRVKSESTRNPSTATGRKRSSGWSTRMGTCRASSVASDGGFFAAASAHGIATRPQSRIRATRRVANRTRRVCALGDAGADEHRVELVGRNGARVQKPVAVRVGGGREGNLPDLLELDRVQRVRGDGAQAADRRTRDPDARCSPGAYRHLIANC